MPVFRVHYVCAILLPQPQGYCAHLYTARILRIRNNIIPAPLRTIISSLLLYIGVFLPTPFFLSCWTQNVQHPRLHFIVHVSLLHYYYYSRRNDLLFTHTVYTFAPLNVVPRAFKTIRYIYPRSRVVSDPTLFSLYSTYGTRKPLYNTYYNVYLYVSRARSRRPNDNIIIFSTSTAPAHCFTHIIIIVIWRRGIHAVPLARV